ncbi:hypothetical protein [Faecalibacterium gallinarum]|uniref:hypothetical protein n=1 Tax=Faecalibacterium gallinarum TaxID=2903556 RepID=UPI001EE3260E|nr:hypothetical protein [Faecalibacterium gallinarum]
MTRYRCKARPHPRPARPAPSAEPPRPAPPAPELENPYGRYYTRPRTLQDLKRR